MTVGGSDGAAGVARPPGADWHNRPNGTVEETWPVEVYHAKTVHRWRAARTINKAFRGHRASHSTGIALEPECPSFYSTDFCRGRVGCSVNITQTGERSRAHTIWKRNSHVHKLEGLKERLRSWVVISCLHLLQRRQLFLSHHDPAGRLNQQLLRLWILWGFHFFYLPSLSKSNKDPGKKKSR